MCGNVPARDKVCPLLGSAVVFQPVQPGPSMPCDFVTAYRSYFPLLVRKCARMLGDGHEAEDVAQETFLRFARSDTVFGDDRAITGWLYRTSTRLAIDRLLSRRRAPLPLLEGAERRLSDGQSPDLPLVASSLLLELYRVATADELEAAVLTRVDGLSQREVAEVMNVHERTVRRLLVRFEERVERLRARSES